MKKAALSREAQVAFLDELQKIAGLGSWAATQGANIMKGVKNLPKTIPAGLRGAGENIGNSISAFATPKASLQRGWNETWSPGGKPLHPLMKGLMAYGAYSDIKQMRPAEDPSGMGRSRLHRGLSSLGNQAGGFIGAPFGLTGGLTASLIGSKLGDTTGRAIDKLRGYKGQPHLPPRPIGQQE